MHISDWSSDVCSSDLDGSQRQRPSVGHAEAGAGGEVAQHVDLVVDVVVGAAKHGRADRAAAESPGNDAGAFLRLDRTARVELDPLTGNGPLGEDVAIERSSCGVASTAPPHAPVQASGDGCGKIPGGG